jgi:hypothetical protein
MSYDPRTIAYMAELVFPPMELKLQQVQTIHNSLFSRPEIAYQNFQLAPDGVHLSNTPQSPGSVSAVTYRADRMIVREELRGITVEEFATRLVNVAKLSFQTLGIPSTVAQQFVVRSLVTPRHVADSREFMARRVIGAADEAWAAFGRPMQGVGLQLTFPRTENKPEVFNVKIETWNQDPRSLWIENVGLFTQPTPSANLADLTGCLYTTYKFITGPVSRFLNGFDRPD